MSLTAVRHAAGFTLLELMVVMILIGIIFSFAMLSMRGDDVAVLMQEEAGRMQTLLRLASDEAVIRGEELAVRFRTDRYEFMRFGTAGWEVAPDGLLKEYILPADIMLRLDVSEDPPALKTAEDDTKKKQEAAEPPPQVFILSSGEMTPFTVQFQSALSEREYLLEVGVLGDIEVSSEDAY